MPQILAMAIVDRNWCVIAWDFKRRQITMFARADQPHTSLSRWDLHKQVVVIMNGGLRLCLHSFFDGWTEDFDGWTQVFIEADPSNKQKEKWYVLPALHNSKT